MGAGFAAVVFGILFFFPIHNPVAFIVINGICYLGYGIAVAILFFVYPLTKQKTAEMLAELKSRRAAKESK